MTLGNGETINTTPGHPFATSSHGDFVLAGDLPLKAQLQEFDGHTATLAAENSRAVATPIFNFEVEDWHTYFVGQSHLWVHNASTPPGWPHEVTIDTCNRHLDESVAAAAEHGGGINYGTLDNAFRPGGVEATITPEMYEANIGSSANGSIRPPGYEIGNNGLDRGHLLGNQLGGSGDVPQNLVTLYHHANAGEMESFENAVVEALQNGETIQYKATPHYQGNDLVPDRIDLEATGSNGFHKVASVPNVAE